MTVRIPAIIVGAWAMLLLSDPVSAQYGEAVEPTATQSTFRWPEGKRVAVSLTFDDGRPSQLDNGLPILDRHGVRATFYVNPRPVAPRVAEWLRAQATGHEIGNHSMNHPCTGNFSWSRERALEDMQLVDIKREIQLADQGIADLLGRSPRTFAYPCGQKFVGRGLDVRSYVPLIAHHFLAGRGWKDEGPNDPVRCDLAQLLGMELDGLDFGQARDLIEKASAVGGWLVLCGHDIGAEGVQTVRMDTLDALCRYAVEPANGVWIDTVERVADYVRRERDK